MSRLLGIELDRFSRRLLIRLGVIGLLVLSALTLISAWEKAQPPSAAELAQAHTWYDQSAADWEANGADQIASCKDGQQQERDALEASGGDPTTIDYGCDQMTGPRLSDYLPAEAAFGPDTRDLLSTLSALYVLVPIMLAASFVAAEFSTGAISNWITFAPRRTRVFLSKIFAAGLATIPYVAIGLGIVIGGSWLVYSHFGTADGGFAGLWPVAGRIVVLGAGIAVLGAALGFLSRHTAAVLGIVIGWLVLVEAILGNVVNAVKPWSLITNVAAWVNGSAQYWVNECTTSASGRSCSTIPHEVSQTHGALVVGGLTLLLVVAALLVFRRRDIG